MELLTDAVDLGQNIYEQEQPTAETNQKKLMVADKAVTSISQGERPEEVVEASASKSVDEMKTEAVNNHIANEAANITAAVKTVAAERPQDLPTVAVNAQKAFQGLDEKRASKITPYMEWVNSLEGSEKLSLEDRESIAIDTAFLQAIAKGADDRAWYEDAWDILGLMAVPDESYNVADLQQQVMGGETGFTEWLGSAESIGNISKFRASLSSAERVMFDEKLVESLQNVDDNKLQQVMLAMNVLGRDPDSETFQALEKIEALSLVGSIGHGLFNGLRTMNVLNRTAKAGDSRVAAVIAKNVTSNKEMAREAGVSQVEAAMLGNPVIPKGVFKGAVEGTQKKYRDYEENITEALGRARNTLGYNIELDTKDADEIVAAMNKNFSKRDDIENIEMHRSRSGVLFTYDVVDADGTVRHEREMREFILDDLGGFKEKDAGFIGATLRGVTSPNTLAGKDRDFFVKGAEASLYAKGRIGKNLADAVDAALAPVGSSTKKLKNVSDMLTHLDNTNIRPDYQTLVVEGVGGKKLNEDEFLAFTGVRKVLDDTYYMNNHQLKREMDLRGVQRVKVEDDYIYSKPAGDANTAYTMFSGDVDNTYIRLGDETLQGIGLEEMKAYYKQGKVLVKSDSTAPQEWFDSAAGKVRYALVDKKDVSELPDIVLNRTPNYLPKMREDANFFIKRNVDSVINNKAKKIQKTIAYAATETQAKAYLQKLFRAAKEAGEEVDPVDFQIVFDREVSKGVVNSDTVTMQGGLVRGKRKSTEIEWAGDFDEGGRTDALDSIQRYMGITADRYSLAEWRMEARTRITNEAASYAEIGDKAKELSWQALRAEIAESNIDLQKRAKLLAMYDQTNEMANIPSATDQRFQSWVKAVGFKMDRTGNQKIAKHLYRMHDKSPVDIMKGLTFNLTLGMFNWVQIPVQLMGATVAASIRPVAATKALPRWLMASGLDFATDEASAKKFIKKFSKDLGVKEASVIRDYDFWRRSGMYESVVRGSADASSIASHLPYDAGVIRRGFNKFVDAGQTPYRMGELSNMRISFFTALEEMKDLQGKSFKYSDTTLQEVIGRAEQFRLNMSGANKAAFQKGIWALPTQFKQIYGKYVESVMGTHFSGKDKAKLLIGQAALFGAAGVPILNHYTDQTLDWLGFENLDLTAEELTTIKRGAIGWALNSELDIDALISGRLTVSADLLEDLRRSLIDTNTPMLKTMLGATFTTGDKVFDTFSNMLFAGNMVYDEYTEGDDLKPAMKAAGEIMARSIGNMAASSRKWLAAWDLTEGMVRKSDGSLLYVTQPELADVYFRAVGFGSQDVDDLYQLRQADVKQREKIKLLATRYTSLLYDLENAVTNQDEASVEAHQLAAAMVKRQIHNMGKEDAEAVMNMVMSRLSNPKDFKEDALKRSIDGSFSEFTSSANKFSVIKQKYLEEQTGGE